MNQVLDGGNATLELLGLTIRSLGRISIDFPTNIMTSYETCKMQSHAC